MEKIPKPYRPWPPLIAGGLVGVVAALIVVLSQIAHTAPSTNLALTDPFNAFGVGMMWGAGVAAFRNWLNERPRKPAR